MRVRHLAIALSISAAASCKARRSPPPTSNPAMSGLFSVGSSLKPSDDEAFNASITCSISCVGQQPGKKVVTGIYAPNKRGLTRGNGNLWGSLSRDLQQFSDEACMDSALKQCGSLAKIGTLTSDSLGSDLWIVDLPILCQAVKNVPSPFEPGAGTSQESRSLPRVSFDPFPVLPLSHAENCQHQISAELCFGDCMVEGSKKNDEWTQTIATKKPGASSKLEVCGDDLLQYFKEQNITSSGVKVMLCRSYFWQKRPDNAKDNLSNACSAMRADVDCRAVLSD